MNLFNRRIAIGLLAGFLAYTGAYIFVYLWRAFRLDEYEAARSAGIWHGDPFGRAILVSVLFAIGLIVLVYVAITRQRGTRSGQVRLRSDLWEWLERESAQTNEPPSRLVERAVAAYRGRLEGTRER
jgi:hypothetical protein